MDSVSIPVAQRQTRQRQQILDVITEADGPLSVAEIHERARRAVPNLGIATVYRTIKLLQEASQIHAVGLPDDESRYEKAGLGHHEHFRCRSCQQVFDLPDCPLPFLHGTTLKGGFVVEDHDLTLYGLCPQCTTPASQSNSAR
jgi:Fur family ferric uptake transcriptional regulator